MNYFEDKKLACVKCNSIYTVIYKLLSVKHINKDFPAGILQPPFYDANLPK